MALCPLRQWHHVHSPKVGSHTPGKPKHTTMAPCNGTTSTPPKLAITPPTIAPCNATTSTPPKLVVTLPPNHRTLQWHPAIAPSNGTTSTQPRLVLTFPPTIAHYNGTLRRHPAMAPRPLHPAMAPCNGTTSTQPQHTTMAPCNGTQQWHHVHSTIAHYNGTQQWHHVHSTIAHYNGTQQWHHVHSTIAHYNGTQQWHHVHCTLQWHSGATSNAQKWFVALPLLEVRTPIAIAIWGITCFIQSWFDPNQRLCLRIDHAWLVYVKHIFQKYMQ